MLQDDGEFDDPYGNPPPSSSSPAARRKSRNKEAPAAQIATPTGRPSMRSPAASASAGSRSYARDRTSSAVSNTTDLGASEKRHKKHGKPRRKGSQELFDVQWESDVKVNKCGICKSDFSIVRRKHHCRHCGRVMCSDCSSFLYFEFSHRKHRVCATCNNQLVAEQDAYDRETLAGAGHARDTASNLFDDSSDDGRPSAVDLTQASYASDDAQHNKLRSTLGNARTPKNNADDEKARKKREKKERKEQKQREKMETKGKATPVATAKASWKQVGDVNENPSANGTSLFDGADDDWFTDVPSQRASTHDSGDDNSEDGKGSKGPGWRDRVKDTYTVTPTADRTSVLAPMGGSTLTAGITGKGYISDQFRYDDIGGPGLGHDEKEPIAMPRPQQQATIAIYSDRSLKPSQVTERGFFSEQFQYDVGGPGLGHDDDRSIAMPRPQQPQVITSVSHDHGKPSPRQLEHDADIDSEFSEHVFQPRLTFKDNLKDMFNPTKRRESIAKRKEKKARASKPRSRGNQNMTLDESNPSYSSEDEPRMFASAMPRPTGTPAQPTFYDDDADKLVVDDSPGFFEATIAEREAQRKKEKQQQKQLASDMAWVKGSAPPPTIQPHRFSGEQDSYSIVDPPSHTSNSPVENRSGEHSGDTANGNAKGGLTGALKRFFGMGSKKAEKAFTPPKPVNVSPTPVAKESGAATHTQPTSVTDNTTTIEPMSGGLERHTVVDYYGAQEESAPQKSYRHTMAGYGDSKEASPYFDAPMPLQVSEASQSFTKDKQRPERKRRGTFDDLFESPKNNATAARYSTMSTGRWAASTNAAPALYGASEVGVSRFDQRRPTDEDDRISFGDSPQLVQPERSTNDPTEAWRQSAAMSLLDHRKDASESGGLSFTWSNVRSASGLGTPTYAVPTSLQPRAVYDDDGESSSQYNLAGSQSAPLGNIMDDLKRGSTAEVSHNTDSVDDFFAEFEQPNDYVFDPETGGYVAARVPPRAAVSRPVMQPGSTDTPGSQTVPDTVVPKRGEGRNYLNSELTTSSSAIVTVESRNGEEGDDEVAEIIVDKISSLESELAALKQLIRNRKGSGGKNPSTNIRSSRNAATKPSARKESIFDNDSSDEEYGKSSDPYPSSVRPLSKQKENRRPGSKKKHDKKRKDSFADLFDGSPNEAETLGGVISYEALFQTGIKESKHEESNDDADLSPKPSTTKSKKSRRRSSHKINDFVATKRESDSDPEFESLKGRRGKQSFRRKTSANAKSADVDLGSINAEAQSFTSVSIGAAPTLTHDKKQIDVEDPIDALFDTSDDGDMARLYGGGDDDRDATDSNSGLESRLTPVLNGLTETSSTSLMRDEVSEVSAASTAEAPSVKPISTINNGLAYSLDSPDEDEADEDDDFSINWSKVRKTKSRRHKHRNPTVLPNATTADTSVGAGDCTETDRLDATLKSQLPEEITRLKHDVKPASAPSAFLTDAASNWMSVSTLEDENINLSLTDNEDSAINESEQKSLAETSAVVGGNDDDRNVKITSVAEALTEKADQELSTDINDSVGGGKDANGDAPFSIAISNIEYSEAPNGLALKQSDAALDIFDKSGDVDFLSITSPVNLKFPERKDENDNSEEDGDSFGGGQETFSFELKPAKKRLSVLDLPDANFTSEHKESSPPSLTLSADDTVELGKYAPSSVASSVDGSVDDSEEASLNDGSVLGIVESQAFDSDWNQMQAKEKERKKRLQAKQRQAQRDKVLRKQGISSKSLTSSSVTNGSSKSKSKSGKKKKKDKDDATSSSSHLKKSNSSRKHRHRDKGDANLGSGNAAPSEPPRSLTEL
ncbi:unnamed protein product [Phytophthora lilii]|uniref:Unnamed protein product n=1 Tax=Phytophthora lilii TaxID=2077276 RepID=A0A9W6TQ53_9STRA|nr:unnamed protein product [Phytophthora lilii]